MLSKLSNGVRSSTTTQMLAEKAVNSPVLALGLNQISVVPSISLSKLASIKNLIWTDVPHEEGNMALFTSSLTVTEVER